MDTMKRVLLLIVVLGVVAGAYAYFVIAQNAWQPPQVVKIQSEGSAGSMFTSWGSWLSDAEEGSPQGLLLRDGDYVVVEHAELFAPYRASDGQAIKITSGKWNVKIGETTVSLVVDKDGLAWVNQASDRQLADLRWLGVPDGLDAAALSALKRIAVMNPNVDLSCESEPAWLQALAVFRPKTLFLEDRVSALTLDAVAKQSQIETLILDASEPGSLNVLPKLPNLRRVFLSDWDTEKAGPLPAGLSNLKVLVIFGDNGIKDLKALATAPAGLEELSLVGLAGSPDLAVLGRLTNLRTLILKKKDEASDLSGLASLQQLRWVGLPRKTTQEQFAAFVTAHPNLAILDMMSNETVEDLSPLTSLKGLHGLVLDGPYKNLDVIQKLTSLRFVGISKELSDKAPDQVAAIRKALPDALVVRVSPFCLGSGWILLLVPVMFAAWLSQRRRWRASALR